MNCLHGITSLSHENCYNCEHYIISLITVASAVKYFCSVFLLFAEPVMEK